VKEFEDGIASSYVTNVASVSVAPLYRIIRPKNKRKVKAAFGLVKCPHETMTRALVSGN
jgi:hypothetical protein